MRWGKVTCFQESRHPSTAEQFAAFSATETCKHSVTCFLVVARGADSRRGMQLACRYCDAKCMDCGAIKRSLSKLLAECLVHHLLVGTYNGLFPCFHSSPTQDSSSGDQMINPASKAVSNSDPSHLSSHHVSSFHAEAAAFGGHAS